MFKVGDYVSGTYNELYYMTDDKMKKAIVTQVKDGKMQLRIIIHDEYFRVGDTHWVINSNKYFRYYMGKYGNMPTKVFFNDKKGYTTLFFDKETIVVKKDSKEKENKELAILWAYFIKTSGLSKTQAKKFMHQLIEEANDKVKKVERKK